MSTLHTVMTVMADSGSTILAAVPNPPAERPPGLERIDTVFAWMKWVGFAIAALALIIGGILMALSGTERRGAEAKEMLGQLGFPILGAIIVGAAAGMIGFFAGS